MVTFRLAVRLAIPIALLLGLLPSSFVAASMIVPGFNSNSLGRQDDAPSSSASLGFTANFFGTSYTSLFVNNNGNVTFLNSQSTYTPGGLGAGYSGLPIIAPFFADVDTRGSGSGVVTYGTGTYNGHAAFGVNWPDVGYYGVHTDKLNNFQLLLVSRPDLGTDDFDIIFNYGQIQWETGDASGGFNGFGGIPAAAGYNAGTGNSLGTYYQIRNRSAGFVTWGSCLPLSLLESLYGRTFLPWMSAARRDQRSLARATRHPGAARPHPRRTTGEERLQLLAATLR